MDKKRTCCGQEYCVIADGYGGNQLPWPAALLVALGALGLLVSAGELLAIAVR